MRPEYPGGALPDITMPNKWDDRAAHRAVRDDRLLSATAKGVGHVLITRAASKTDPAKGRTEGCWAWSHARIAADAGLKSRSAVKEALQLLRDRSVISVRARTVAGSAERDVNEYCIEVGWETTEVGRQTANVGCEEAHGGAADGQQVGRQTADGGAPGGQIRISSSGSPSKDPVSGSVDAIAPTLLELELVDAKTPKAKTKREPKPMAEIPGHSDVIAAYVEEYEKVRHVKPIIDGKQGKGAKELLATTKSAEAAIAAIRRAFAESDFVRRHPDLLFIAQNINDWRGTAPPLARGRGPRHADQTDASWEGT